MVAPRIPLALESHVLAFGWCLVLQYCLRHACLQSNSQCCLCRFAVISSSFLSSVTHEFRVLGAKYSPGTNDVGPCMRCALGRYQLTQSVGLSRRMLPRMFCFLPFCGAHATFCISQSIFVLSQCSLNLVTPVQFVCCCSLSATLATIMYHA